MANWDPYNEPVQTGGEPILRERIGRGVTYLALGLVTVGIGTAFAADPSRTRTVEMPDRERGRVVVSGCPSEDSCRIDYRRGSDGEPVWVIRRQVP